MFVDGQQQTTIQMRKMGRFLESDRLYRLLSGIKKIEVRVECKICKLDMSIVPCRKVCRSQKMYWFESVTIKWEMCLIRNVYPQTARVAAWIFAPELNISKAQAQISTNSLKCPHYLAISSLSESFAMGKRGTLNITIKFIINLHKSRCQTVLTVYGSDWNILMRLLKQQGVEKINRWYSIPFQWYNCHPPSSCLCIVCWFWMIIFLMRTVCH